MFSFSDYTASFFLLKPSVFENINTMSVYVYLIHGRTADALCYVLPPKKYGDLIVMNCYISKCLDFQKKLIDTITTCNFNLKFKENNDMAAQVFYSSQRPSQIRPDDFDSDVIPPPIFSMTWLEAYLKILWALLNLMNNVVLITMFVLDI